jgi:hypothetical protein
VVSYSGRFAPAVAVPLASVKGGKPATELTSSRSNTTNGDATSASADAYAAMRLRNSGRMSSARSGLEKR